MTIFRDTLLLIKSIGLPGLIEGEGNLPINDLSILQLAELNKIPLFFLESLRILEKYPPFEIQLSRYRDKQRKTLNLIAMVSGLIEESGIHYTIFKTLKPFPYTPSDIDILLRSKSDLASIVQILMKRGFKPLNRGLYGLNMFSIEYGINIDITTEIAVAGLIYLPKNLVFEHVNIVKINGFRVRTLKYHAEIVVAAAHSLYKEQMYTLSDYYTFALHFDQFKAAQELARQAYVVPALDVALCLTNTITSAILGSKDVSAMSHEDIDGDVMKKVLDSHLNFPLKYDISTLFRLFSRKLLEDQSFRESLPSFLKSMFTMDFYKHAVSHIVRQSY